MDYRKLILEMIEKNQKKMTMLENPSVHTKPREE